MSDRLRSPKADAAAPAAVQLRLLGRFELAVHGEARTALLTYDKPRALLAVLALAMGEPVSRAQLADMLFPDVPETQGKARVRHALHVVRQALAPAPEALTVWTDQLSVDPGQVQVDVAALLREDVGTPDDEMCLAMYGGPLLADLAPDPNSPLGEWVRHWQRRLETRLAQSRERLAAQWLASNRLRTALEQARRWVERWPDDESCHRLLIDALVRNGHYAQARQAYAQCEAMLAARSGAAPDARTRALLSTLPQVQAAPGGDADPDAQASRCRPLAVLAISVTWRLGQAVDLLEDGMLESLDHVNESVHRCIRRHGGWTAPAGANQILVYFGFPVACERPVLRAAALGQALAGLRLPSALALRMGLHAEIGICDLPHRPDSGAFLAQAALALLATANPGDVAVSAQAARRLDEYGIREERRHGVPTRLLGARRTAEVSRMHGRSAEFAALVQAWRLCLQDHRVHSLALVAAAGMGKSLLADSLAQHARQTEADVAWLRCLQDQRGIAMHPFRHWLGEQLPIEAADVCADVIGQRFGLPVNACRGLAELMQAGADAVHSAPGGPWLQAACHALVGGTGSARPLLIVVEDVHWADEATRQWLALLAGHDVGRPVLLLTTQRGVPQAGTACVTLGPLARDAAADMVASRCRALKLPRQVRGVVSHLGRGNPLHMAAMLAEAAARGTMERPARLRDATCAQLAALDADARGLAGLAAIFGAPLADTAAAEMMGRDLEAIARSRATLCDAGLLSAVAADQVHCPPLLAGIVRDLTDAPRRRRLSADIAHYLMRTRQPRARVAEFLQQAADARAPIWWRDAAADAMGAGRVREAADLLDKALRASDMIHEPTVRERFVFGCHIHRGTVATALSGPAHPAAATAFEAAALLKHGGDLPLMLVALWGQWLVAQNAGAHAEARRLAQQLAQAASIVQDAAFQGWASYALAQHHLWRGYAREAAGLLIHAEKTLTGTAASFDTPFGGQPRALVSASLAVAQALLGRFDDADAAIRRSLALAEQGNSLHTVLLCELAQIRILYLADDLPAAARLGQALVVKTAEADTFAPGRAIALGYAGLARVLAQRDADALADMEAVLPVIRAGMPVSVDGHLCLLARAHHALGDPQRAIALLDEAQALAAAHGSNSLLPEIDCIRGDIWMAIGDANEARAHWQHARAQAEALELRPYVQWSDKRLLACGQPHRPSRAEA